MFIKVQTSMYINNCTLPPCFSVVLVRTCTCIYDFRSFVHSSVRPSISLDLHRSMKLPPTLLQSQFDQLIVRTVARILSNLYLIELITDHVHLKQRAHHSNPRQAIIFVTVSLTSMSRYISIIFNLRTDY